MNSSVLPQPDDGAAACPPPPSPLAAWAELAALSLVAAAVVARLFTSGGGIELLQPGAQVLFDSLAFAAVLVTVLARALRQDAPFRGAGWTLLALVAWALVLVVGAARASHADLAWRTAATWSSIPFMALCARDLAQDRGVARWLVSFVFACVLTAVLLGAHQYLVEIPAMQAEFAADGAIARELATHERGFRVAFTERLGSRQATGPFLLPGLFATACCALLPLAVLIAWARRRSAWLIVALGCVSLLLAGLVFARSKGSLVTFVGVGACLSLLLPALARWRRRLLFGGLALSVLLTGVGLLAYLVAPERFGIGLSLTVRLEDRAGGLRAWLDAPLLGVGPNHFREVFPAAKSLRAEETLHAHNLYVQVLCELGVVGALTLAALLVVSAWEAVRSVTGLAKVTSEGEQNDARAGEPQASDAAASPKPDEAGDEVHLPEGWQAGAALVVGVIVGWLLIGSYGDVYTSATGGHWGVVLSGVVLGTLLVRASLGETSATHLGVAALAGASALLFDGLLNFGFHHAGLFTLGWLLLGLAPALAERLPTDRLPVKVRALIGAPLGLLALGLLLLFTPACLEAERERSLARDLRYVAAQAAQEREDDAAREALEASARSYEVACERYAWDVRSWLELGSVRADLASFVPQAERGELYELALSAMERAQTCALRAHDVHAQRGELLQAIGRLADAQAAFDAALALYPGHPDYQLRAGLVAAERHTRSPDDALRAKAVKHLQAAHEASETTRLVRRKLTPGQRTRLEQTLERLGSALADSE